MQNEKSSLGIEVNLAAMLVYAAAVAQFLFSFGNSIVSLFLFAVPFIFFFAERRSPFVKYHAAQMISIVIVRMIINLIFALTQAFLALLGIGVVAGVVGTILWLISWVIIIGIVYLGIGAFRNKRTSLPIVGEMAYRMSSTFTPKE